MDDGVDAMDRAQEGIEGDPTSVSPSRISGSANRSPVKKGSFSGPPQRAATSS
jgi:hypothetical protein